MSLEIQTEKWFSSQAAKQARAHNKKLSETRKQVEQARAARQELHNAPDGQTALQRADELKAQQFDAIRSEMQLWEGYNDTHQRIHDSCDEERSRVTSELKTA